MDAQATIIVVAVAGGLLLDGIDYLTYRPPGAIGFGRQLGVLGALGRTAWVGGIIAFCIVAVIKVLS